MLPMTSEAWLILATLIYVSAVTLISCVVIIFRDKSSR